MSPFEWLMCFGMLVSILGLVTALGLQKGWHAGLAGIALVICLLGLIGNAAPDPVVECRVPNVTVESP